MDTWHWLPVPNMLTLQSSRYNDWLSRANMLTLSSPNTHGVFLYSLGPGLVFGLVCSGVGVWAEFLKEIMI